jgi:hypothetical protein
MPSPQPVDRHQVKAGVMSQAAWQHILFYILAYLLWLVNTAVCVLALLEFRSAVNVFWVMTGRSLWALGLANQAGLLPGGLAVLAYVVCLEGYYRGCVAQLYALLRRFAWTIAIPIGVLLGSLVIRLIAFGFTH